MKPSVAPHSGISFQLDLQEGSVLYTATPFKQARLLPISPVSYGHFIAGPGHFTQRTHSQNLCQIFITLGGSGRFLVDGREFIANPGSIALLDCSRPNRYEALSGGWDHEWVNFSGPSCGVYYDLINPDGFAVHPLEDNHTLTALMHEIRDTLSRQDPIETVHISTLIIRMLDAHYRLVLSRQRTGESDGNISRAIRYMDEHYDLPLTLDQLAQTAYLSKFYFARAFRKSAGMTPMDYLNAVRVHHAQNLLLTTELTVEEIALRTGYSGSKNLIRQFSQITGMTPGEYRKTADFRGSEHK